MSDPKKILHVIQPTDFTGNKPEALNALFDKWYGCTKCDLAEHREDENIVFCSGNPDSGIMIIGEAPGEEEESTGMPFVGRSGELLNQMLAETAGDPAIKTLLRRLKTAKNDKQAAKKFHDAMLDWRTNEFFITNMVACRPPENATPNRTQTDACLERVVHMIQIVDPMLILAVGKTALEVLAKKKIQITTARGKILELKIQGKLGEVSYPMVPILHPSYLLRKADWNSTTGDYWTTVDDIRKSLQIVDNLREAYYRIPMPDRS